MSYIEKETERLHREKDRERESGLGVRKGRGRQKEMIKVQFLFWRAISVRGLGYYSRAPLDSALFCRGEERFHYW